ncbi:MAG: DUF4368 domain-containing protein [Oscillospiraceae bacterium]|nr:MAG: DUF4368 domain-containing protein [Oscillospiraceae bacterium]
MLLKLYLKSLKHGGRLQLDEDISSLNCGGEDFAVACMRANLRYEKNQKREDVKSHHYIISFKSAEKFIALIDKYENFDTLTNTMLNEFVEKILVHERARKGSQDTTQEIEIYFNFLGRYIPPSLQPVPLTPEEQEELRKKEERKDRLHQNYLKRKASGAQKRYEDKIKAKKKAEMDAKKALIRAEDMKKGVFSTIGQLPKEEPRKGSIAASAAV